MQFVLEFLTPNLVLVFFIGTFVLLGLGASAKNKPKLQIAFSSLTFLLVVVLFIINGNDASNTNLTIDFYDIEKGAEATATSIGLIEKISRFIFSIF